MADQTLSDLMLHYDQFKESQAGLVGQPALIEQANKLLGDIRRAGEFILDPEERSILSSLARDLGGIVYQASGEYPEARLSPPNLSYLEERIAPLGSVGNRRQQWLKILGFDIDPFLFLDGAQDPHLLRYFYRIPGFFEIYGDVNTPDIALVFGPRGSGKSSLRNALVQMYLQEGALPVLYTDLQPVVDLLLQQGDVQALDHVHLILKAAISALARDMDKYARIDYATPDDDALAMMRTCLWSYVSQYEVDPVRRERLRHRLSPSDEACEPLPQDARELLGRFCRYATRLFGFASFIFLVDPDGDISSEKELAWQVLEPLLADRQLLARHEDRAAFKFLLSEVFLEPAKTIPWVEREYARRVYRLAWDEESLRALLAERLRGSSRGRRPYDSLGELSEASDLDDRIIEYSGGSPLGLVTLSSRLFSIHCQLPLDRDRILITSSEITQALKEAGIPPTELPIEWRIAQGKDSQTEFIASAFCDPRTGQKDAESTRVTARLVSSLMNTEGGVLIIGIDEAGKAVGLQPDLATLPHPDERNMESALAELVNGYLGIAYSAYAETRFHWYQDKRICVIRVRKSEEPVFFQFEQDDQFYVRKGISLTRLGVRKAVEYARQHFPARTRVTAQNQQADR